MPQSNLKNWQLSLMPQARFEGGQLRTTASRHWRSPTSTTHQGLALLLRSRTLSSTPGRFFRLYECPAGGRHVLWHTVYYTVYYHLCLILYLYFHILFLYLYFRANMMRPITNTIQKWSLSHKPCARFKPGRLGATPSSHAVAKSYHSAIEVRPYCVRVDALALF